MPSYKYVIELSEKDRAELIEIITKGSNSARKILRANILLASDKGSDKYMTIAEIAEAYHTTPTTVQNVRTAYCEKGLEATVNRKKRETPPVPPKITGEIEAHIIALACSEPPEGYAKWTLRLIADKTVELGYINSISHVTVSNILRTCPHRISARLFQQILLITALISLAIRQYACGKSPCSKQNCA